MIFKKLSYIAALSFTLSLGTQTAVAQSTPNLVKIASSAFHNCAIADTGQAYCWGDNAFGELGTGTRGSAIRAPVAVVGVRNAVDIAVGASFSCAVRRNGRVACWGYNVYGTLGNGSTRDSLTPVEVQGLRRITHVVAGEYHACALNDRGRVFCWGSNSRGQLGDDNAGWGVAALTPVNVSRMRNATQIAAGGSVTCAVRENGRAACWGANNQGQLGDGTNEERHTPTNVRRMADVTQVTTSGTHSCVLQDTGRVFCFGGNNRGQLGDGTSTGRYTRVRTRSIRDAVHISAGAAHTCAVRENGRVLCWGDNQQGELGDGRQSVWSRTPVRTEGIRRATSVSLAGRHSCAVERNGNASCWGLNSYGQLGAGRTDWNIFTPTPLSWD